MEVILIWFAPVRPWVSKKTPPQMSSASATPINAAIAVAEPSGKPPTLASLASPKATAGMNSSSGPGKGFGGIITGGGRFPGGELSGSAASFAAAAAAAAAANAALLSFDAAAAKGVIAST